jgi:DNA-binding transcriptional MerR regulator
MATSINEDVVIGSTKFHVQTEFYHSSGKVVSNIFKEGVALKRLEKEVGPEENIEEEVKSFHLEVVNKLLSAKKGGAKKRGNKEVSLTDKEIEEIVNLISPFYGVASTFVIYEALSSASSKEEFIQELLGELSGEEREKLQKKIEELLGKEVEIFEKLKDEILEILNNYFGIMALSVFEEAFERTKDKSFEDFIREVSSQLEGKEREEIAKKLKSLSS